MTRLDVRTVALGYFKSRSQAQLAIRNGEVSVNGAIITKTGFMVSETDEIAYQAPADQFVSRGGYKLLAAIAAFDLNLNGMTVLDIGASTGGFTDCALQHGARKVYAYDVGHDQLDPGLREDCRVIVREGINCRQLTRSDFTEKIDFICMDVSFISCTKMLEAISSILESGSQAVILFKPQFEVGSDYLNRQGVVTSDKIALEKLNQTMQQMTAYQLNCIGHIPSPIKGGDGNKEYLLLLQKK